MIRNPAKALLRKQIKETLKELAPAVLDLQSKAIQEKTAQRVSIYLSTSGEVNTVPILEQLFKMNKQVFVPTYHGNNMEMVRLHSMSDYESLSLTKWHIKQPVFGEKGRENALETGGLDLVILPGAAFTKHGGRCGHGMGYYDKFLHRLFATAGCTRDTVSLVGLAFKEQIVDEETLPVDEHDVLLDQVITGE